jgi:hypothetical protein
MKFAFLKFCQLLSLDWVVGSWRFFCVIEHTYYLLREAYGAFVA